MSRDGLRYTFTLREELRFHDGQPVTADDCVVSLQRWGKRDHLGKLLLAATGRLVATTARLSRSTSRSLSASSSRRWASPPSHVPFIMPARLAVISESGQVKEQIGSGPYRFLRGGRA